MKKLLTAIALVLTVTMPALSDDTCTQIALYAEKVMEYRQAGKSIIEAFKEIPAAEIAAFPEENLRVFREGVIKEAYGKPFFSTSEMKTRATVDFMNSYYLGCEKAMKRGSHD